MTEHADRDVEVTRQSNAELLSVARLSPLGLFGAETVVVGEFHHPSQVRRIIGLVVDAAHLGGEWHVFGLDEVLLANLSWVHPDLGCVHVDQSLE